MSWYNLCFIKINLHMFANKIQFNYGSHVDDSMFKFNENGDYETMKALKFKIKLLCLLPAIRLVDKGHKSYLSYH